jgi:hypothetical protein
VSGFCFSSHVIDILFFVFLIFVARQKSHLRTFFCSWNFFAPSHGKNACNGHGAYVNSTCISLAVAGRTIDGPKDLASVSGTLNRTHGIAYEFFDRSEATNFSVAQVSGEVRKWRCFEFDGSNDTSLKKVTLKTKLLSIDEDDAKTNGELVIETFFDMDIEDFGMSLDVPASVIGNDRRSKKRGADGLPKEPGKPAQARSTLMKKLMTVGQEVSVAYERGDEYKYAKWYLGTVVGSERREDGSEWVKVAFPETDEEAANEQWVDVFDRVKLAK